MNDILTPRVICILGMHRSGTSAITRILNLLGVELGTNLMPPAPENPEGFWENLDFVNVNEELLSIMGARWDDITRTFVNPEFWAKPELTPLKNKIKTIITSEFTTSPIWGWKDPRTCLLFPFWSESIKTLQIQTDAVVVWRNPLSVAKSLVKRNGFSAEKSYRLWYAYTLSALYHSRDLRRVIIDYDTFMDDWNKEMARITKYLQLPWSENDPEFVHSVESFLRPELRHSLLPYDETMKELPAYAGELYNYLVNVDNNIDDEYQAKINSLYSLYSSLEQSNPYADLLLETANVALYHSNDGIFSEKMSFYQNVIPAKINTIAFNLTSKGSLHIRFDPLERPGILNQLHITVSSENKEVLFSTDLESIATQISHTNLLLQDCIIFTKNRSYSLICTSNDPQIILPPLDFSGHCYVSILIQIAAFLPESVAQVLMEINDSDPHRVRNELLTIIKTQAEKITYLEQNVDSLSSTLKQETLNSISLLGHMGKLEDNIVQLSNQYNILQSKLDILNINYTHQEDHLNTLAKINEHYEVTINSQRSAILDLENSLNSLAVSQDQLLSENTSLRKQFLELESSFIWRIAKSLNRSIIKKIN